MPFTITITRETGKVNAWLAPITEVVARAAVGTLEDAKTVVWDAIHEADAQTTSRSVARARWAVLTEAGGSVSLPDGMEISVEPVLWSSLANDVDVPEDWGDSGWSDADLLAAWNSKHAVHVREGER